MSFGESRKARFITGLCIIASRVVNPVSLPPHLPISLSFYLPVSLSPYLLISSFFSPFSPHLPFLTVQKSATLRQIVNFIWKILRPPIPGNLKYRIILAVYKIQQKSTPWQEICLYDLVVFSVFLFFPGPCVPFTERHSACR
jgi:hypothetical protein